MIPVWLWARDVGAWDGYITTLFSWAGTEMAGAGRLGDSSLPALVVVNGRRFGR